MICRKNFSLKFWGISNFWGYEVPLEELYTKKLTASEWKNNNKDNRHQRQRRTKTIQ